MPAPFETLERGRVWHTIYPEPRELDLEGTCDYYALVKTFECPETSRVKNREKLPTFLMHGPLIYIPCEPSMLSRRKSSGDPPETLRGGSPDILAKITGKSRQNFQKKIFLQFF